MDVTMDPSARGVWEECYAPEPSTILSKLLLGHEAHRVAMRDASLSLMQEKMAGGLREVMTSVQQLSANIQQRDNLAKVESKLTSKGRQVEATLVDMLRASSAFAEVYHITEKDSRGKIGGDVLVRDREGNGCVIEMKDKGALTIDDFLKFEGDSRAWQGPESLFVFCRRDGVGTNRRLQTKPQLESITPSRSILWFKGDISELCQQLPMILSMVCAGIRNRNSDNSAHVAKLLRAKDNLTTELNSVRARLGALEKEKLDLKKNEAKLVAAIEDVSIEFVSCADITNKKRRIIDEVQARMLPETL